MLFYLASEECGSSDGWTQNDKEMINEIRPIPKHTTLKS